MPRPGHDAAVAACTAAALASRGHQPGASRAAAARVGGVPVILTSINCKALAVFEGSWLQETPPLLVAGAMKAGTNAMCDTSSRHPQLLPDHLVEEEPSHFRASTRAPAVHVRGVHAHAPPHAHEAASLLPGSCVQWKSSISSTTPSGSKMARISSRRGLTLSPMRATGASWTALPHTWATCRPCSALPAPSAAARS